MDRVWILAAGNQERWGIPYPKQLVPIGDELLLQRTIRQVDARGHWPIVLTHDPVIIETCNGWNVTTLVPGREERRWAVESALTCARNYGGRQAVLLGDVMFTDAAMDAICGCKEPLRVFMRTSLAGRLSGFYQEIFGFVFDDRARAGVLDALNRAREHAISGGAGKLREFYCAYCGFPFPDNGRYPFDDRFVHWPINDQTDDVDSVEDYAWLIANVIVPKRM